MNDILISIIIPCYNQEKFIEKAIQSLLVQKFSNFEIIVINDGSTDNSLEVINNIIKDNSKVKCINKTNEGLSVSRNVGLKHAIGDYIFFLDGDDWVINDFFARVLPNIYNGTIDILVFNQILYNNTSNRTEELIRNIPTSFQKGETFLNYIIKTNNLEVSACFHLYKRSFLTENNIEFVPNIYHEDILFSIRAYLSAKSVTYIPEALYYYRKNTNSITSFYSLKHIDSLCFICKELFYYYENLNVRDKRYLYFNLVQWIFYTVNITYNNPSLKKRFFSHFPKSKLNIFLLKIILKSYKPFKFVSRYVLFVCHIGIYHLFYVVFIRILKQFGR